MPFKFVKMHGTGNDFVVIDALTEPTLEEGFDRPTSGALVRAMCDRNFGIGADGVILACKTKGGSDAHVRMRIFNSDGHEAEMCGNGLRCLAKFAHDRLGLSSAPLLVDTKRGTLPITLEVEHGRLARACVDMGAPVVSPEDVPIDRRVARPTSHEVVWEVAVGSKHMSLACVSMGNPHAVCFVADVESVDLPTLGPLIERHPAFPNGVNVHIAEVCGPKGVDGRQGEVRVRTWERGVGLTLACGTGACAVVVAGVLKGVLERSAVVHVPGGEIQINWHEGTNRVRLAGPAVDVFQGEWLAPSGCSLRSPPVAVVGA